MHKTILCICVLFMTGLAAQAQFHTSGDDPGKLHWNQIKTQSYQIIYPRGLDSLALVMARNLETWKKPVGNSIGYTPGQFSRKRLPVILHAHSAYANGMVTWAPSRMELQTTPDPYKPLSQLWDEQLVIHESRHVAQMQLGCDKRFGFFNAIVGQMWAGAVAGLYPGPAFMEGDAVVTETALSMSGRGRSSDFLEYWRVAFDQGDYRNYWRWVYGSRKFYTTDHYAAGYVLHSGLRSVFDVQDFPARYNSRIFARKGMHLRSLNLQKTVKESTGLRFKDAFSTITDTLAARWSREADSRAPYTPMTEITAQRKYHTGYEGLAFRGDSLLAIRKSMDRSTELACLDTNGVILSVKPFASMTSILKSDCNGKIYWSEYTSDMRWEMASTSRIRRSSFSGTGVANLTTQGRMYNPSPSPDGSVITVTEYPVAGGSRLVFLDGSNGNETHHIVAPDGMQLVESEWIGDRVYVSAITSEGFGIYLVDSGHFIAQTPTVQAKIHSLRSHGGNLLFISDRSGVNEVYSMKPGKAGIVQLTSTRNGVDDFLMDAEGRNLYLTVPSRDGRMIFKASADSLRNQAVDFARIHEFAFAEKLSAQESAYPMTLEENFSPSKPEPYSKLGHLFRFHSWAPVSINYDAISSMSMESITSDLALGATGFFQNSLGTASGYVTWFANNATGWRNGAAAKFTYTGLFPIFELSADVNKADAVSQKVWKDSVKVVTPGKKALVRASALIYLPFKKNSGGWSRGLVPQLKYNISNDNLIEASKGSSYPLQVINSSLRGYAILSTPTSAIYPRLGIGLEAGYHARLNFTEYFRPIAYAYAYGYLPGFAPGHGIRISAMAERNLGKARFVESHLSIAPRGFAGSAALRYMCRYDTQTKLSFDYAMPLLSVDWAGLSPFAYLRNFELTAHYDLSSFSSAGQAGNLSSAGADLVAVLGNLAWLPYDTRVGVTYNYNFGSDFNELRKGSVVDRHYVGLVFSIKL